METILIAGLGNPGKAYAKTRHNTGFVFVDYFFEKNREEFGFSDWKLSKKLKSEISIGKINPSPALPLQKGESSIFPLCKRGTKGDFKKIILLKPQTFMNLSGVAVAAAVKYYKINFSQGRTLGAPKGPALGDLIVAHDDIDLTLGKYKISENSSSAGHNGVQNIIDILGTKDFTRLRIGIDNRRDKKIETEKYVLEKFTIAEMKIISKLLPEISDEIIKNIALSSRA